MSAAPAVAARGGPGARCLLVVPPPPARGISPGWVKVKARDLPWAVILECDPNAGAKLTQLKQQIAGRLEPRVVLS